MEMFEIYFFHYFFLLRAQEGVILNKIRNSQQNWCAENSEKIQLIIQISWPIFSGGRNNSFNEGEKLNQIHF
jgi:outer membrane protein TolC